MLKEKWDLQLFAEDEEGEAVGEEPEEVEEVEDDEPEQTDGLSQRKVDEIVKNRLSRFERKWAKEMGANDMNEAVELAKAGRTVSEKAGLKPRDVVGRLNRQVQNQPTQSGNSQQGIPQEMKEEMEEIKAMLASEREEKIRTQEEKTARTEFGNKLFEEHQTDIEDLAEDKGLTLQEAAAIVLQPKLKEQFKEQTEKKKQVKRKRSVDSSEDKAADTQTTDYESALTPAMKRGARKMGMSYQKYYEQAKQTGLLS